MKLVFYSGGDAGDNQRLDKNLISLTNKKNPKMTFIPACSYHSAESFSDLIKQFSPYGVRKFLKFDIDQDFSSTMKKAAFNSDIIYLGGGNTFYFLKYLRMNGLLADLRVWAKAGGVLTGLSAGAILMCQNIETAGFPSFDRDDNDEKMKKLSALQLVNFEFFPHYKNSKRYDQELSEYSKKLNNPLYACPDGSGIILHEDEIHFFGKTVCFVKGNKFIINKIISS